MHRRAALIALLQLCACLGDPKEHLENARELTFRRQPQAALAEYEEVLSLLAKKDGRRVRALVVPALKGAGDLCYLELKKIDKAVDYYRTLTRRYPEAPEALQARSNLSDILRMLGDRRAAVAELSAIVQAFPDAEDVDRYQYLVAKDYFELGDYDQVLVEVRVLEERFPKTRHLPDAHMLAANALALQSHRDKAIEAYDKIVQRWAETDYAPRALEEKAKILADLGKEADAVDVLVEALKTHPDPKLVQNEIARLRKRLATQRLPQNTAAALGK